MSLVLRVFASGLALVLSIFISLVGSFIRINMSRQMIRVVNRSTPGH